LVGEGEASVAELFLDDGDAEVSVSVAFFLVVEVVDASVPVFFLVDVVVAVVPDFFVVVPVLAVDVS
jgi:hypothetical protein